MHCCSHHAFRLQAIRSTQLQPFRPIRHRQRRGMNAVRAAKDGAASDTVQSHPASCIVRPAQRAELYARRIAKGMRMANSKFEAPHLRHHRVQWAVQTLAGGVLHARLSQHHVHCAMQTLRADSACWNGQASWCPRGSSSRVSAFAACFVAVDHWYQGCRTLLGSWRS